MMSGIRDALTYLGEVDLMVCERFIHSENVLLVSECQLIQYNTVEFACIGEGVDDEPAFDEKEDHCADGNQSF